MYRRWAIALDPLTEWEREDLPWEVVKGTGPSGPWAGCARLVMPESHSLVQPGLAHPQVSALMFWGCSKLGMHLSCAAPACFQPSESGEEAISAAAGCLVSQCSHRLCSSATAGSPDTWGTGSRDRRRGSGVPQGEVVMQVWPG